MLRRLAGILFLGTVAACDGPHRDAAPASGGARPAEAGQSVETGAVELRPSHPSLAEDDRPDVPAFVATTSSGALVIPAPAAGSDAGWVTVISADGTIAFRIARRGRGPGEVVTPGRVFTAGDTIFVSDPVKSTLELFGMDGSYRGTVRVPAVGVPMDVGGRQVLVWHPLRDGRPIVRYRLDGRELASGSTIVAASDSFYAHATPVDATIGEPRQPDAALGPTSTGIADRYTLQVMEVDSTGRRALMGEQRVRLRTPAELAEARRRLEAMARRGIPGPGGVRVTPPDLSDRLRQLARDSLPHFAPGNLHLDAAGRIWLVASDGDRGFVEVYAGGSLEARKPLDCRSPLGSDLEGDWLVVICQEEGDSVAVLRYQVEVR